MQTHCLPVPHSTPTAEEVTQAGSFEDSLFFITFLGDVIKHCRLLVFPILDLVTNNSLRGRQLLHTTLSLYSLRC